MKLLKEIPGYKRILRTVIQMQISQLVDQLAEQTGDECIILVASIPDKSLCQLGTKHGQEYLSNKDDLKKDFLDHCLQKFQEDLNSEQGEEGHASSHKKRMFIENDSALKSKKRQCQYKRSSVTPKDKTANYNFISEHSSQSTMSRTNNTQSTENTLQKINASEDVLQTGYSEDGNEDIQEDNRHMLDNANELIVEDSELNEDENVEERGVVADGKLNKSGKLFSTKSLKSAKEEKRKRKVHSRISHDDSMEDMGGNDTRESEINLRTDLEDKSEEALDTQSKPQKEGQTFISGKALSEDLRTSIIFEIIENGGDVKTGFVPHGVYTKVRRKFSIPATSSVTRTWERYIHDGTVTPKKRK